MCWHAKGGLVFSSDCFLEDVGLGVVSSIMAIHGPTPLSPFRDRACRAATCKECLETQVLLEAGELQIDKPRLIFFGGFPRKSDANQPLQMGTKEHD